MSDQSTQASVPFPPADAPRAELDRFMLRFTHRERETIATYDDWNDGTYATPDSPWPERFNIAVVDAKGRVVRCGREMKRTIEEDAFPVYVWAPIIEPVKFIPFAGQNCSEPCRGWDKKSNRCDCGNRRVYWDTSEGRRFARAD